MAPKTSSTKKRETSSGRAASGREQGRRRGVERAAAERKRDEAPWEKEVGVRALVDAVRDLSFPRTLEEIVADAGTREVRTSVETQFPLAYVVLKLKEPSFDSLADFQTAVQRHWAGIESLEVPPEQRRGHHEGEGLK